MCFRYKMLSRKWSRDFDFGLSLTVCNDSPQLLYQNLQQQVTEDEVCDEPKCPCDQSCDHEEEEQPLMKTNNYQFCWRPWLPINQQNNHSSTGRSAVIQYHSQPPDSCRELPPQLFFARRVCCSNHVTCFFADHDWKVPFLPPTADIESRHISTNRTSIQSFSLRLFPEENMSVLSSPNYPVYRILCLLLFFITPYESECLSLALSLFHHFLHVCILRGRSLTVYPSLFLLKDLFFTTFIKHCVSPLPPFKQAKSIMKKAKNVHIVVFSVLWS